MTHRFPEKLQFLFRPARYKVAYGGRGSAKSWSFARALLVMGASHKILVVCARETQKSIADSVHRLLSNQIGELGLSEFYEIQQARIVGKNGTEFVFAGLKHNIDNIKSLEGANIVWVEEAQTVSRESWDKLIPTVRASGSEIWVTFNPELESDETYQRFVVNPPRSAVVVEVNYCDNPWFPDVLEEERLDLLMKDEEAYANVWLGKPRSNAIDSIYSAELRAAENAEPSRITNVAYDPTRPVHCYWDLGYGDSTAIWMIQHAIAEHRVIDYLESSSRTIDWYLKELASRGYRFGEHHLPWDIGMHAKQMGSGKSVEEIMRGSGHLVRMVPKMRVADGINALRTLFPLMWFDRARCAEGLSALRRYCWTRDAQGNLTREPRHDGASHGADALRMFAQSREPVKVTPPLSGGINQYMPNLSRIDSGWMAG